MRNCNDLARAWKDSFTWQDQSVEFQRERALSEEVAGIAVVLEMSANTCSAREHGAAIHSGHSEITKHGIADFGGFGREIRLVHGATQQRSGRKKVRGFSLQRNRQCNH